MNPSYCGLRAAPDQQRDEQESDRLQCSGSGVLRLKKGPMTPPRVSEIAGTCAVVKEKVRFREVSGFGLRCERGSTLEVLKRRKGLRENARVKSHY